MSVSLEGMTPEQIADLAVLAKAQLDNPKTRAHFLRNSKVVNPEVSIPEVDIPMQVDGMMQKGIARLEALEAKTREAEIRQGILESRASLMEKHNLSKSEVAEVEKLMLEKHIASHDTAAEFFKSQKQSAPPTPSLFTANSMPKIDLKGTNTQNMSQWARQTAGQVIDEMRGRAKAS